MIGWPSRPTDPCAYRVRPFTFFNPITPFTAGEFIRMVADAGRGGVEVEARLRSGQLVRFKRKAT